MKYSYSFAGFTENKARQTPIPNQFFSELLPSIDHLGELKITLYAFWAIAQKDGPYRYISKDDMLADHLLLSAITTPGMTAAESLQDALERATARGTLLSITINSAQKEEYLFFLNTPGGHATIGKIEKGEWLPDKTEAPIDLSVERPNIFTLFEQNIGPLTPMIAETLRDAEQAYPESWITEAIQIAVENNVRKWRYIRAILEDWQTRGKDERKDRGNSKKDRRRYLEGEYADYIDE